MSTLVSETPTARHLTLRVIPPNRLVMVNRHEVKRRLFIAAMAGAESIVIDLSYVTEIDPAAWGMLIGAQRTIQAHINASTKLVLYYPTPDVLLHIRATKLDRLFNIVEVPTPEFIRAPGIVLTEKEEQTTLRRWYYQHPECPTLA